MEVCFQAFVSFEQNDWARLLPMTKFAYNNVKDDSTGHTPFKLNCDYYPYVSYEKDVNFCSQSKLADELVNKLLFQSRTLVLETIDWEQNP